MALQATVHRVEIGLSDVDRNVYETLDLRVARHPSESLRYLALRILAYALNYEDGIAFSKGGVSSTEEAPVSIRDATGVLVAWIDIGLPAADRLHKAAKAARRVTVYTEVDPERLRKDARTRGGVHRAEEIEIVSVPRALVDALEAKMERHVKLEISRNDGVLYVTIGKDVVEATPDCGTLA